MALSCDEAGRLLVDAMNQCKTTQSLAQVMVSISELHPGKLKGMLVKLCGTTWPENVTLAYRMASITEVNYQDF